jgi:zinc D-Ala-D-Ala carboxypeptidase
MAKRELVSKNFFLDEFTYSPTAKSFKMNNEPNAEAKANLRNIIKKIAQPVRDNFKKPLKINSGYRSPQVNVAVGGASKSQHTTGEAIDIEIEGVSNKVLADWIDKNLEYDQLILEFYNPMQGVNSGWVHVSLRKTGKNRKNKLVAYKDGKATRYEMVTDFTKVK